MARRSILALVSGGADSAVMLSLLARRSGRVHPVYVRFGLRWERAELTHLRSFLRAARIPRTAPLAVFDLPVSDSYGKHWSVTGRRVPGTRSDDRLMYLPGRNLLLVARAAVHAALVGADAIAIGTLRGNPFPDATRSFRSIMGAAASRALRRRLRVVAPLGAMTKADVLRAGKNLPLHLTFTCASPVRGRHCGRCNKCAERRAGFRAAGIPDRTRYR